jgi:D-alanyl-D-alanine carboxypeptidase
MRLPPRLVLAVLTLAAAPAPSLRAEAPEPPRTFDVKAVDEYLAAQVRAKGFTGLSVAVMRDGKVVLARGYGKASLKGGEPVTTGTLFAAGSVTKQFTCACVLLLAEEGKLSVHDKVAKYYAGLTRADDITLYDLMTHASGYPDYYPLDFVDRRMEKAIAPDDLIRKYAGGKLDFEPGTRWSYSNTGYVILGRVVEKVSGKPFGEFLEERILKPLGMADTAFEPKPGRKGLATGYTAFALGDPEPATPEADGWVHAAGALWTTPSDLLKWDLALAEGKVLKPESSRLMTEPRKLADGRVRDYGCGLAVGRREGEAVWRHGGAVSGFLTFNAVVPRTKSGLALMTNCDHLDAAALNTDLLTLLLRAGAGEPDVPAVRGPSAKEAALDLLRQLQAGEVKRGELGEDFGQYLTRERAEGAKERLRALGDPEKTEVEETHERGGMEVTVLRFTFKGGTKVKAYLYRTPDGKVQEFLLYKG